MIDYSILSTHKTENLLVHDYHKEEKYKKICRFSADNFTQSLKNVTKINFTNKIFFFNALLQYMSN